MARATAWFAVFLALQAASEGHAQVVLKDSHYSLTVEAFANVTAARNTGEDTRDSDEFNGHVFGELRLLGLIGSTDKLAFGPRFTLRGTTGPADDTVRFGESSLLLLGPLGRVEVGRRRGLPDVLTGYAPNNYQFVSAEFGPASGPSLDPDGGLQTTFLSPQLANELNSLSSLGITSSLFFDESSKIIYVSPKTKGFLGGVSFSPNAEGGNFDELLQAGLTYEHYWKENVFRVGGTYAYAEGKDLVKDLNSYSAGAALTLANELTFAASFTYNGDSGLRRGPGPTFESDAFGYALSANYNTGPWTFGGFYQRAESAGNVGLPGDDRLQAFELGLSYRTSTRVRFYGAGYFYRLRNEGGGSDAERFDGSVFLVGTRITL
jgi:hypothetical protein